MAHYDKDTEDFMSEVAGTTKSVAKQVLKGAPLSSAVGRELVKIPTRHILEKQSGMKVLAVFKLLNTHYGHDWWDWEPETLWQTLKSDHDIEATEEIKNIIQALQVVVKTDYPFEEWHVFENVTHAFNKSPVSFARMQPVDLDEAALTIRILKEIRPKSEYHSEVCGYLGACAKNCGMVYLPEDIFPKCAQDFLDEMGNNLELKHMVMTKGSGEAYDVQMNRLKAIRQYVEENQ